MKDKLLLPLLLVSFLQMVSFQKLNAQTTQLWSMTRFEGANSGGVILSYNLANGNELVQYSFSDPSISKDGMNPYAGSLAQGMYLVKVINAENNTCLLLNKN